MGGMIRVTARRGRDRIDGIDRIADGRRFLQKATKLKDPSIVEGRTKGGGAGADGGGNRGRRGLRGWGTERRLNRKLGKAGKRRRAELTE